MLNYKDPHKVGGDISHILSRPLKSSETRLIVIVLACMFSGLGCDQACRGRLHCFVVSRT